MEELKIYLPAELKEKFKKQSMEAFGYGKGSISKAAEEAIQRWVSERERPAISATPQEDPEEHFRGMLRDVKETGVELQHQAGWIRAQRRRV